MRFAHFHRSKFSARGWVSDISAQRFNDRSQDLSSKIGMRIPDQRFQLNDPNISELKDEEATTRRHDIRAFNDSQHRWPGGMRGALESAGPRSGHERFEP